MKIRHIISSLAALAIATASPLAFGDMHKEGHSKADKNIPEVAMGSDQLSTLVSLLKAGELVEALSGEGPFTVFAPQNEAFGKLTEDQVAYLTSEDGKESLQKILKYHVISGKVMAADVSAGEVDTLAEGAKLNITVEDGTVMINDAKVIATDVKAGNGVVHIIDGVLVPEGVELEG